MRALFSYPWRASFVINSTRIEMGASMSQFWGIMIAFALLSVVDASACSTCADSGMIDRRETCGACRGDGKVANARTIRCPACLGDGRRSRGLRYQGTFCRACGGTGVRNDTRFVTCGVCSGAGYKVARVLCPTCKGASAVNGMGGMAADMGHGGRNGNPAVATVSVDACTRCDEKGNVFRTTTCDVCDHGLNHKKNDSGAYVCRSCGAVCQSRFKPCTCGKRDCPNCQGEYEKKVSEVCPLCGGDKIITPLERERAKKGEGKK